MTGARALRRAMAVVLALPLTGVVLVGTAAPASADVTQPGRGTEYTEQASRVSITADFGGSSGSDSQRLYLTPPEGGERLVASADGSLNGGTLGYAFDLDCWTDACAFARNGTWTIRQEGSPNSSSFFVTRIAPAAPQDVTAAQASPKQARITWKRGKEPDLTGFQVVESGAVVKDGIGMDACDGATCSAVVSYASEGSGDHTYAVRAFRATEPGSDSTLASPLSANATTRLEKAPASPAPAPSTGGGSPGGPSAGGGGEGAGDGDGGTTAGPAAPAPGGAGSPGGSAAPAPGAPATADQQAVAQRKAFALGFSAFGPKLGIPKLPPLPQQPPAIAPELADGTFEPTLGYEDQVLTEEVEVAQGPTTRVRNVVDTALDSERLATSTAAALLLLLAGAHLRRWLGAATEE